MRKMLLGMSALLSIAASQAAADTKPVAREISHACLPPELAGTNRYQLIAGFTVDVDGSVKDVWLASTNGSIVTEEAVNACLRSWRYRPSLHDGEPVAAKTQELLRWNPPQPPEGLVTIDAYPNFPFPSGLPQQSARPVSIGMPHVCSQDYPERAKRLGEEGTTVLNFTVTVEGAVTDVTIVKSSGFEDLDAAATSCVAKWLYRPAYENGTPNSVRWAASVGWS